MGRIEVSRRHADHTVMYAGADPNIKNSGTNHRRDCRCTTADSNILWTYTVIKYFLWSKKAQDYALLSQNPENVFKMTFTLDAHVPRRRHVYVRMTMRALTSWPWRDVMWLFCSQRHACKSNSSRYPPVKCRQRNRLDAYIESHQRLEQLRHPYPKWNQAGDHWGRKCQGPPNY